MTTHSQSRIHRCSAQTCRGFSLVELLVVIAVIVILLSVLAFTMSSVYRTSLMTSSQSNLRQIHTWMGVYAADNRDIIVPSRFDYRPTLYQYKGKVRHNIMPTQGRSSMGTWTDILWTAFEVDALDFMEPVAGHNYSADSPDKAVYEQQPSYTANPLRSAALNTRDAEDPATNTYYPNPVARPFGDGAMEAGLPGFFAANDYFNAHGSASTTPAPMRYTRPNGSGSTAADYTIATPPPAAGRWHTNGEIKFPNQSMYLVDSFAGEIIEGEYDPAFAGMPEMYADWYNGPRLTTDLAPGIVDFRYNNSALMLFLDGHIASQGHWDHLEQMEKLPDSAGQARGVRVTRLRGE